MNFMIRVAQTEVDFRIELTEVQVGMDLKWSDIKNMIDQQIVDLRLKLSENDFSNLDEQTHEIYKRIKTCIMGEWHLDESLMTVNGAVVVDDDVLPETLASSTDIWLYDASVFQQRSAELRQKGRSADLFAELHRKVEVYDPVADEQDDDGLGMG